MAIDRTTPIGPPSALPRLPGTNPGRAPEGSSFGDALALASDGLQLSKHAQKRIDRRELDLDPARMTRLNSAISRAAEKGSRNSVVMLDDLAVVVNVRDRTVVTAMNTEGGREKVFTNIDSVVIA